MPLLRAPAGPTPAELFLVTVVLVPVAVVNAAVGHFALTVAWRVVLHCLLLGGSSTAEQRPTVVGLAAAPAISVVSWVRYEEGEADCPALAVL